MHTIKITYWLLAAISLTQFCSCKKYLDAKPDQALVTPSNLADARALLDTYDGNQSRYATLSHASNDDFYVLNDVLQGLNETDRGLYLYTIRQESLLRGIWLGSYSAINRANLVIDFLNDFQPAETEISTRNDCMGHAYFLRGLRHFNLALYYAEPYLEQLAQQTPGLPIRRTPDINEPTVRGTLEETYVFILQDLENAIQLLPERPSAYYRPGKAAAFTLKAWVLLHMQQFDEALQAAESALAFSKDLMDYNTINPNATISFARHNAEVLFQAQISGSSLLTLNNWKADSLLYSSYGNNDLRRVLFFNVNGAGTHGFKGDYGGTLNVDQFAGITTGETYMMAAEAAARLGQTQKALQWLNALLVKRFKTGTYIPYDVNNANEAFSIIREERRKEFAGRGLRWFDLRRWNYEGVTSVEIVRKHNGTTYVLSPKSKNYVFEIPADVINMSGILQNERE
jgi:tetratricopeptide (TPR) repeat protein